MKIFTINLLLILLFANLISAQEVKITKWAARTVDSLQKAGIDTVEYYHKYCDGCMVPPIGKVDCKTRDGQMENTIIYRQKGKFYSLIFNCDDHL